MPVITASVHSIRALLLSVLLATAAGCTFTENRSVPLLREHLACESDADCTQVALWCSSCGDDAVATAFAEALVAERRRLCKRYRGPLVGCYPPGGAICHGGVCVSASPLLERE